MYQKPHINFRQALKFLDRKHFPVGSNTAPLFLTWGRNIVMKEQIALENGNGENKAKTAACMGSVYNSNVLCSASSIFTVKNEEMRWKWATLVEKRASKPKPFKTNLWITPKTYLHAGFLSHYDRHTKIFTAYHHIKYDCQNKTHFPTIKDQFFYVQGKITLNSLII